MTTYQNFIGGEWMKSSASKSAPNVNPANTDDVIGDIPLASREEARRAVEAAADAFPKWRSTPAPTRGRIVAQAARLLEQNKEELAQSLTREEGKTIAESRGELQRSINVADFCAGESRRLTGETIPSELPLNFAYTIKQPLGVVACVTPWNFPVAIPAWKLVPALLCGNAVLLKPASQAPAMSLELAKALSEAGLPKGVLNVVIGEGRAVGASLATHAAVSALSFTGSYAVGHQIYQQLTGLINIVIVPLLSIVPALLYLKMRQLGGEDLADALAGIEEADDRGTEWQQRMRTRLSLHTSRSKGTDSKRPET